MMWTCCICRAWLLWAWQQNLIKTSRFRSHSRFGNKSSCLTFANSDGDRAPMHVQVPGLLRRGAAHQ